MFANFCRCARFNRSGSKGNGRNILETLPFVFRVQPCSLLVKWFEGWVFVSFPSSLDSLQRNVASSKSPCHKTHKTGSLQNQMLIGVGLCRIVYKKKSSFRHSRFCKFAFRVPALRPKSRHFLSPCLNTGGIDETIPG